jgi:hypothetical protein
LDSACSTLHFVWAQLNFWILISESNLCVSIKWYSECSWRSTANEGQIVKSTRCKKTVATIKPTKVTYVDLICYYLFIYFVLYDALSTSGCSRTAGLHDSAVRGGQYVKKLKILASVLFEITRVLWGGAEIIEWYFEFLCIKIRV